MSVFSAPKWDVDESNEKISSDVFGGNISPLKGKGKSKKKKNQSLKNKSYTSKEGGPESKQNNISAMNKPNIPVNNQACPQSNSGLSSAINGSSPKKSRRQKKKKKTKNESESKKGTSKLQEKFEKILKIGKKKKKALAARENQKSTPALMTSTTEPSTSLSSLNTVEGKSLKKKLRKQRRKEVLKKRKEEALAKQESKTDSNEIVLPYHKKKKMRKNAKKGLKGKLKKVNANGKAEQGMTNPSFDTSFSEGSEQMTSEEHQQTNSKKKKNRKKKKQTNPADSVDGNLVSSVSQGSLQGAVIPSVEESASPAKESKKKKVIIAKLLKEASIKENTTLYDLKKKRREQVEEGDPNSSSSKKKKSAPASLTERMSEQLKSARFRWLNEQLYSSSSTDAATYFKEDPEAYNAYHSGYRNQVAQWPLNPVDVIAKSISSLPSISVVADFGCGDAKLAESLPSLKVHSLDLVASKPGVVACDMAHTPLLMDSVDVVVFCLSLMGTNLNDFILEANRVLKNGGLLMIAEVESRFEDIDNFTSAMSRFGFQLKNKDLSNQMFIFMDFKKVQKVSKTGKLPVLALEPCVYKKR